MRYLRLTTLSVLVLSITSCSLHKTPVDPAQECDARMAEGRLIVQQLKAHKMCGHSLVHRDWMDCTFTAGKTELMVAGLKGATVAERMTGVKGSGFYVRSLDDVMNARAVADPAQGLLLRVDRKNSWCDVAYITLNGKVLSSQELYQN